MDVDSVASVTLTPHEAMFKPGSLVATSKSFVEVANGQREAATHIGTLLLDATDLSGAVRRIELPGVWFVPSLAMSLLSVRAIKKLGWRAPDFENLLMYDRHGNGFPIADADPSYTLASRVVAPDHAVSAAVLARGRTAIPTSKSSAVASAEIFQASFGHLSAASLRSIVSSTDGVAEPEKVIKGIARLGVDEANMLANASHKPAPDADVKDRVEPGFVAGDIKVMNVACKTGPFKGALYAQSWLDLSTGYLGGAPVAPRRCSSRSSISGRRSGSMTPATSSVRSAPTAPRSTTRTRPARGTPSAASSTPLGPPTPRIRRSASTSGASSRVSFAPTSRTPAWTSISGLTSCTRRWACGIC